MTFFARPVTIDAERFLVSGDASRNYDPSPGLEKIKAAGDVHQFGR